jgi:hypothetical protein
MNKDLAAKVRSQVEDVTHVPDALHDLGLSDTAVGLFVRWLRYYQHGDVLALVQAVGYIEAQRDPEIPAAIAELRESGILPSVYRHKADDDAAFLAEVAR